MNYNIHKSPPLIHMSKQLSLDSIGSVFFYDDILDIYLPIEHKAKTDQTRQMARLILVFTWHIQ